jgi:hypothetical protein
LLENKLYIRNEIEEHLKRRKSVEVFYKNYLKEIEDKLEIKLEKAKITSEQYKRERINKFAK